MAKKKSVKKKVAAKKPKAAKKTVKKPAVSSKSIEIKLQPVLVNNFVALQRVMVNLSTKFERLNTQLSTLLNTFEMAAKTLAKKDFKLGQGEDSAKVVNELKELKEQNKVLAKGLTMLHEDEQEQKQMMAPPMRAPAVPAELEAPKKVPVPKTPKMPEFPPLPKAGAPAAKPQEGEYQKSEENKPEEPSK